MGSIITKAPGIEDIYPDSIDKWNFIINTAKRHFNLFNFREIIVPVLEYTDLFSRGIGEETDIVSKEMFTFEDRGGRSLTLRPEGTASVVRAYCENGDYNRLSSCKFSYCGPMFRAEKPQKGRLRQFNQFGAEIFGEDSPYYDFEVISMMRNITNDLGISNFEILINSIGCRECRQEYVKQLKSYFHEKKDNLCETCKRRLETNPLRILDCKNDTCRNIKNGSPRINDYICDGCKSHHEELKNLLDVSEIKYKEDPYLVRGLDYYTKTTFEFVTTELGGQNAFAAGGRYNDLVEMLGGKPTNAVGFAAGIERLCLLTKDEAVKKHRLDVYIVHSDEISRKKAFEIVGHLRKNGISADTEPGLKGFKSQLKKAERESAKYSILLGENEITNGFCTVKNFDTRDQKEIDFSQIVDFLKKEIGK